jgi:hypothetical protein
MDAEYATKWETVPFVLWDTTLTLTHARSAEVRWMAVLNAIRAFTVFHVTVDTF